MTRDEAIKIIHSVTYPETNCGEEDDGSFIRDQKWSARIVDGFSALGILKLDEPKSVEDKFVDALKNKFSGEDRIRIYSALSEANLKLVEK